MTRRGKARQVQKQRGGEDVRGPVGTQGWLKGVVCGGPQLEIR